MRLLWGLLYKGPNSMDEGSTLMIQSPSEGPVIIYHHACG